VCNFCLLRVSNLCEHQTKAVFGLKLMVGGGEHKVVLDESGLRMYCAGVDRGLNFLSVKEASVDNEFRTLMLQEVIKRGVLFQGMFVSCFSHQK